MVTQDQIDEINDELDDVANSVYESLTDAWVDVALLLENHGITVPPQPELFEEEMLFALKFADEADVPSYRLWVITTPPGDEDPTWGMYASMMSPTEFAELDGDLETIATDDALAPQYGDPTSDDYDTNAAVQSGGTWHHIRSRKTNT